VKASGLISALPRVLVIDDQFGRCQLGEQFRNSVGEEVFALYEADRANLCRNFGLVVHGADVPEDALAQGVFCPAQRWNPESREIENEAAQAIGVVRKGWPARDGTRWALVLLDLRFTTGRLNEFGDPEHGSLFGVEVLLPLLRREFGEDLPIVVLSSANRDEMNQRIRQLGALDFIQRVPGAGAGPKQSRKALSEVLHLHALLPDASGLVVGSSLPVLRMLRQARRGARSARTILLEGETGTGKGLLARYIHGVSGRGGRPYETFNAAQRSAELQADELFGHWPGAFTGAGSESLGLWERANGGSVFIDEVADLNEDVQLRLMQPIEERKVRRIGHPPKGRPTEIEVDVLVLLATNRALANMESMKKDFLNRISAFVVHVPPLRERLDDLPALTTALTMQLAPTWSGRLLPDAQSALAAHDWRDGNIRELRNVLEQAIANNPVQDITARDLKLASRHERIDRYESLPRADCTLPQWQMELTELFTALQADLDRSTIGELRRMRQQISGVLPDLLARILKLSLRLTAQDGKLNHTAAVRLLLGRDRLSTLEAKQFLNKLLTLDTREGSVWRRFLIDEGRPHSPLLDEILASLRHRRITKSGEDA
jgi:DNA-binding NtrC family response regulator